jgi:superfamily II DNA or RNA helicase
MAPDIKWSIPYKASGQWKREWCIPAEHAALFFVYWKKNKYKLLSEGFTVTKTSDGKWFLIETQHSVTQFKKGHSEASRDDNYVAPHPKFILPKYNLKLKEGLHPWQIGAVEKLVASIKEWNAAIDGSDTGVGKSYSSCALARELNLNILVICPKAVMSSWRKVICDHFGMSEKLVGIINYEKLRTGRKDSEIASFVLCRKTKRKVFTWKIPKRTLIVFDESQKLKNFKTQNAKICITAIKEKFPLLFCSATNATNPLEMRVVGLALGIYKPGNKGYYEWAMQHGVQRGTWGLEFKQDRLSLKRIHHTLFNQRGVRLRRDEIPGFPECEVIPNAYNIDDEDAKQINSVYEAMELELKKFEQRKKGDGESQLTIQLRARQKIELIKVPLMVSMIEDALEEGFSIAVFINFTDTLNALSERLKTNCVFDGKTKDKIRDQNVDNFQNDSERVILINIQSGGAGLNLHDLHGNFPRMSIISPSYSPVHMRQALGRIWRDGSLTKAIQKIVFAANTVEEVVCRNVQIKLSNLDMLNDGDLLYSKNYEIINN